ncbi:MAG: hypothetical protein NTX23_04525 [Candidatus Bipolaricaulota bacterium]|nr:hypothetical protein [Candidatus Bipolaricaulota bacterium]
MNQKTKRIGMVVTLMVLAALAVTGVLVFAQSASNSSNATAAASAETSFLSKLAKNLGIDESKLTAAIETAQDQTIDEALAAGRITQEQATAMKERHAAEKAMEQVIADGVASGKITQAQADLMGVRGLGGPMMADRGLSKSGLGAGLDGSCGGRMGRGMGR